MACVYAKERERIYRRTYPDRPTDRLADVFTLHTHMAIGSIKGNECIEKGA